MKVVLLHALPLSPRMWEGQRAALAAYDVETPSLYDLGGNSMDEWADAVLESVGGQFVAVGASMGGYCASAIARKDPGRLQALVLAGSRPDADPADRRPVREEMIRATREGGAEALWSAMAARLFPATADPGVVEAAHVIAIEQSADGLVRAVEAIRDRHDSTEAVTRLDVPLLVLTGDDDPFVPVDYARGLAADAAHGRLHVVEGAGHLSNLERPDEFNRVLSGFLAAL